MNKRSSVVLIGLLFLPLLVWARSEGHFDRTLQVSGAVNLDVSTGSGDITVKSGSSNQVVIHGTVHSSNWVFGDDSAVQKVQSNPPIEQSGNSIRIGYNLPDDVKRHVAIDYEITLPPDTTLQAHSGSGNVSVEGVRSPVDAQTGSGDIRLRDIGSKLHAQTGSGNIRAETVAAPFWAQTGSGDIEADLTGSGDVDVHTGSGTIRVRGVKGGVRARTGSGNVETDGAVAGPWQLHSGSGNITLAVGSGNGFNLDVHTSSGSIHSDLPITVQGSLGKHELKGTVKGGGPEVEVSTGSGDVELR
jgi:Putative adhesin